MPRRLTGLGILLGLTTGIAACHTVAGGGLRPAVLLADTAEARKQISAVLLRITRDGQVSFGDSDLGKDPLIVVQPPAPGPYEGNSPAMPTYFELLTDGTGCFLRELDRPTRPPSAERPLHPLPGVRCRAK